MESFKNDLGWYFNETSSGFHIRRKDPSKKSLRNRIIKTILIWIVIAIISFFGTIAKEGSSPEFVLTIMIPFFLIIAILGLLGKFWLLRIAGFQRNTSSLAINGVVSNSIGKDPRLPSYLFKAEIDHNSESGFYSVYLRPSEFLEIEGPAVSKLQNVLVWETTDEQEAAEIVENLCQCGIGEKDFEKQHPFIPGNKKIGIAVLVCWILCLFAVMFYLKHSMPSEISNFNSTEFLLHMIKTVVIFALLSVIAYACYNIWFGVMAIKDRQIPSPRTIFFSEMRLFHGDIAVKRGRKIVTFGVIVIVISLIAALFLDYKLKEMIPPQNNQQTLTTNSNS